MLALQAVATGTPLSELWQMPADETVAMIAAARRRMDRAGEGPAAAATAGEGWPTPGPRGALTQTIHGMDGLKAFIRMHS